MNPRRLVPFAVAAVLLAVGILGLVENWKLAAAGFELLPGMADSKRLTYVLAFLPTAFQAWVWSTYDDDGLLSFWNRQPMVAVVALFLSAVEINFVRLGLEARLLLDHPGTQTVGGTGLLLLGEALFIALGAEALIVWAGSLTVRGWQALRQPVYQSA